MSRVAPKANPADALFGDFTEVQPGGQCVACKEDVLREAIENALRGMLGEGPWAGKVPLAISCQQLHRRFSDPERAKAAGLPVYPRKRMAFEAHLREHRTCSELWARVKQAKQAADCR